VSFLIKDEYTFFVFPILAIHLLYKASGFHFVSTTCDVYKRHVFFNGISEAVFVLGILWFLSDEDSC
jgi:hypothetical protein